MDLQKIADALIDQISESVEALSDDNRYDVIELVIDGLKEIQA